MLHGSIKSVRAALTRERSVCSSGRFAWWHVSPNAELICHRQRGQTWTQLTLAIATNRASNTCMHTYIRVYLYHCMCTHVRATRSVRLACIWRGLNNTLKLWLMFDRIGHRRHQLCMPVWWINYRQGGGVLVNIAASNFVKSEMFRFVLARSAQCSLINWFFLITVGSFIRARGRILLMIGRSVGRYCEWNFTTRSELMMAKNEYYFSLYAMIQFQYRNYFLIINISCRNFSLTTYYSHLTSVQYLTYEYGLLSEKILIFKFIHVYKFSETWNIKF